MKRIAIWAHEKFPKPDYAKTDMGLLRHSNHDARAAVEQYAAAIDLPSADPVRFGPDPILDALADARP